MTSLARPMRILGLDIGAKRTGVAVADELGFTASPVGFILRGDHDRAQLRAMIERFQIYRLVVGLPATMTGREGPQAADVRSYADTLAADVRLPLVYWDERFTSTIAQRSLIDSGARKSKRREQIDAVAAAVMLQNYLDAEANRRRRAMGGE
jgi:putative Holliday junction resolvase